MSLPIWDSLLKIVVLDGQPYGYYNPTALYQKHIHALSTMQEPIDPSPASAADPLPTNTVDFPRFDPHQPPSSAPPSVPPPFPAPSQDHWPSPAVPASAPSSQSEPPALWVGNIPDNTPPSELYAFFGQFGPVTRVKTFPNKNFVFVSFSTPDTAAQLHASRQQVLFRGTPLKFGMGKPGAPQQQDAPQQPQEEPSRTLWVGGLTPQLTVEALRQLFAHYGAVEDVKLHPEKKYAFVDFFSPDSAGQARQALHHYQVAPDRYLRVSFAVPKGPGLGGGGNSGGFVNVASSNMRGDEQSGGPQGQPVRVPSDPAQKLTIDTMAKFVVSKGPFFERMIQERERRKPEFEFLFGGPYHAYYLAELQRLQQSNSSTTISTTSSLSTTTTSSSSSMPFNAQNPAILHPSNLVEQLLGWVESLDGTKTSITAAGEWCVGLPPHLVSQLPPTLLQIFSARSFDAQKHLYIAYLLNEMLYTASLSRPPGGSLDPLCKAFLPYLSDILSVLIESQPDDGKDIILRLLPLWQTRQVFSPDIILSLQSSLPQIPDSKRQKI